MPQGQRLKLNQRDLTPYVTFGTDSRGNRIWLVVSRDTVIECPSGNEAVQVMEAIATSKGII